MKNVKNHAHFKNKNIVRESMRIRVSFDIDLRSRDFLPRKDLCRKVTANDTIVQNAIANTRRRKNRSTRGCNF